MLSAWKALIKRETIGIVYLFIDYIKTRNLKFISIYFLMHAVVSRSVLWHAVETSSSQLLSLSQRVMLFNALQLAAVDNIAATYRGRGPAPDDGGTC